LKRVRTVLGLPLPGGLGVLQVVDGRDRAASVDDVLLQLVGLHAVHHLAAEVLNDLSKGLGHLQVGVAHLHEAQSGLRCVPRRVDDVGTPVFHLRLADHHGVGRARDEAIDVARHVNLSNVSSLEQLRLAFKRRIVTNELID